MRLDPLSVFLWMAALIAAGGPLEQRELADVDAWVRRLSGRDRPTPAA